MLPSIATLANFLQALILRVGLAQGELRIDLQVACEVDHGKQQVADLVGLRGFVRRFDRDFGLGEFFADLGQDVPRVDPVEAGAGGGVDFAGGGEEVTAVSLAFVFSNTFYTWRGRDWEGM